MLPLCSTQIFLNSTQEQLGHKIKIKKHEKQIQFFRSGIRIQGGKNDPQNQKKIKKFHVLKCWMFSFKAEGFFCSLDVLYGGLGIGKLQFCPKYMNFCSWKFFVIPGSGSVQVLFLCSTQKSMESMPEHLQGTISVTKHRKKLILVEKSVTL